MLKFGWFDAPLGAPTTTIVTLPQEAVDFINQTFGKPEKYYYSAQDMRMLWRALLTNGLVPEVREVTSTSIVPKTQLGSSFSANVGQGLDLIINKGIAWVEGAYCIVTEPETVRITAGQVSDVVLRLDYSGADVDMRIIARRRAGVSMAADLVRTENIYELGLFEVSVSPGATQLTSGMITDRRLDMTKAADGKPVCGLVGSLLQPDVTEWYNRALDYLEEFRDYMAEFKEREEVSFSQWRAQIEGEWQGALTVIKNEWNTQFLIIKNDWTMWQASTNAEFYRWFGSIKDVLDENTAAQLFNLVDAAQLTANEALEAASGSVKTVNGKSGGEITLTAQDVGAASAAELAAVKATAEGAQGAANSSAAGLSAHKGEAGAHFIPGTATRAGMVVAIVTPVPVALPVSAPVVVVFTAPEAFAPGDTYTLNGQALVLKTLTGEALDEAWTKGAPVELFIAGATGFFRGGGGGRINVSILPREVLKPLSAARRGLAAATDGSGNVLALGGRVVYTPVASVDKYTAAGVQSTLTALSHARGSLAAAKDGSGNVLALGGYSSNVVGVVDKYTAAGVQSTLTALSVSRTDLAAATDGNGNVLALGGGAAATATIYDTVDKYTAAGVRSTLTALSAARRDLAAATDGSGNVLALGGDDGTTSNSSNVVDKYTAAGVRSTLTALNSRRRQLAAAKDGSGNVLALGGCSFTASSESGVDKYTAAGVRSVLSLSVARFDLAVATDGSGNVLALGGWGRDRVDKFTAEGIRSTFTALSVARGDLAAATDGSGNVLALGGNSGTTPSILASDLDVVDKFTTATHKTFDMPPNTKYKFTEHATEQTSETGVFTVQSPNTGYIKPGKNWAASA